MTEPKTTPKTENQELQETEASEQEVKGAGKEEVKGKAEVPPKKEEKTHTQADIDKLTKELETEKGRYGGLDKKLTEAMKTSKENVSRLETALEEQQQRTEDARDLTFLKKVEDEDGDVNAAKALVAREKTSRALERDLAGRKRTLDAQETILAEAGKAKKATDLIKEHKLEADVVDELLGCATPAEMEIKALKMRLEKGAIDAKPVTETDSHEKGGKTDIGDMSTEERLGKGMEGTL